MDYWLGIDGGGTKTDFQLINSRGEISGGLTTEGVNSHYATVDGALGTLRRGVMEICRQVSPGGRIPIRGTIISMAGISDAFRRAVGSIRDWGEIFLVGDHVPVLHMCGTGDSCLVVHAGTGSFVTTRFQNRSQIWGGYGYLLQDPGSGSELGRRALRRLFDEYTGIASNTEFGSNIRSVYGMESFSDLIESVYGNSSSASTFAECARVILEGVEAGDAQAVTIVKQSFGELAELVVRVVRKLPSYPEDTALSGKIFSSPRSARLMREALASQGLQGEWKCIAAPPIEGVRKMLIAWAGGNSPHERYNQEVIYQP